MMKIVRTSMKVLNTVPVKIKPKVGSKVILRDVDGVIESRNANQPYSRIKVSLNMLSMNKIVFLVLSFSKVKVERVSELIMLRIEKIQKFRSHKPTHLLTTSYVI